MTIAEVRITHPMIVQMPR